MHILTYKYRVKDATTGKHLARHAIACNQVWNFCVETQRLAESRRKAGLSTSWPTATLTQWLLATDKPPTN